MEVLPKRFVLKSRQMVGNVIILLIVKPKIGKTIWGKTIYSQTNCFAPNFAFVFGKADGLLSNMSCWKHLF
jgi:hypothetical protein